MNKLASCPIMSKVCKVTPIYTQNEHFFDDVKIIVTSCFRNNERCIVYIPGYDDYFYHHHVVSEYPNIDFMSIDIPGFGYNKGYPFDNHLENISKLCLYISKAIIYYLDKFPHMNVDILGFSMGGHIAMCYVWLSERVNYLFRFRKLLLTNPLTCFHIKNNIVTFLAEFISRVTYLFSSTINIKPTVFGYEIEDYLEMENIYENELLKQYHIDDFNTFKIGGEDSKPFSNGTMVTIVNNVKEMINSDGIKTPTLCICSEKFGSDPLKKDGVCDPVDTVEYLPKICKNLRIEQFECGHQPFRQPYYAKVNFVMICDVLFEE